MLMTFFEMIGVAGPCVPLIEQPQNIFVGRADKLVEAVRFELAAGRKVFQSQALLKNRVLMMLEIFIQNNIRIAY